MNTLQSTLRSLRSYPSASVGLVIIGILLIISVVTPFVMPYSEAVRLWRGGEEVWIDTPRNAPPTWYNWFTSEDLPVTLIMDTADGDVEKVRTQRSEGVWEVKVTYDIPFNYDAYPQDLALFSTATFSQKAPHIEMVWLTPDGREVRAGDFAAKSADTYRFSQDSRLQRRLDRETGVDGVPAQQGLFDDPAQEGIQILKGDYQLQLTALLFEEESDVDTKLVMYGQVYGWAGTDHRRRDIGVALAWGTPIAMSFGLLAAVGTTITTMVIAAIGVWFGGVVDGVIQRMTEVNNIIPLLPILIMVGTLYNRSIWLMLGLVILLSIFGISIKNYRAIFLQVRELPYIDAARAYGASGTRIIFRYLIPRILPLIIPALVALVPSFVFLEASLAVLGLGDPVLPTWGKLINDAYREGALFNGFYYWILQPAALLMLAGLGFAMVGFALDRIFNPRLREI